MKNHYITVKRILITILAAVMICVFMPVCPVLADESHKTVRVGWFETPLNSTDESGRRMGYAYEYLRKIAAYTGWNYEYVEGSWPELINKLETGEIDLLSDVSYTEERAGKIRYASLPMGTETYFIYITPDNEEINPDDLNTLNGKIIGVMKDSMQENIYLTWAKNHSVHAQIKELEGSEDEAIEALRNGEMDAYITFDFSGEPASLIPVSKIGSSDFYFAVSKSDPSLITELNSAMSKIQDENRFYNQELYARFLEETGKNRFLSADERAWLSKHGTIRVGYQDNYLAFCAKDPESSELTGALKDYLEYASVGMENATIVFSPIAYPTASDALEAMKRHEVDCMFPANFTSYDGETMEIVMTQPLMTSEMLAVVREKEMHGFISKENIVVAVNEGNLNYDRFLEEHFPYWERVYYKDTPRCIEAVAAGDADCVLISNYRYNNISKQCEKLKLSTVPTGVVMDYSFAVCEGDSELYSILTKVTGVVPVSTVSAALTYYSVEEAKVSFFEYIRSNLAIVLAVVAFILMAIVILLLRSILYKKKAAREQHMLDDLSKRVNFDALTSVRNKGAFNAYMDDIQKRIDAGEEVEFAVCILDCNDLKRINDRHGHDRGDEYLKASCRLICHTFRRSAVFRIGGDEFSVVMMNDDYQNREALAGRFDMEQKRICEDVKNDWEKIQVALGMAVYDAELDRKNASYTVRRADEIMYENKRIWKEAYPRHGRE